MDEVTVERVLRAVEQVPPARVVSYGDLGALVGIGPRQVGRVMRLYGGNVAWWRVTGHDGRLPPGLLRRALEHWSAEGITTAPGARGCRIREHRADLARLATDYEAAVADLPPRAGTRHRPGRHTAG